MNNKTGGFFYEPSPSLTDSGIHEGSLLRNNRYFSPSLTDSGIHEGSLLRNNRYFSPSLTDSGIHEGSLLRNNRYFRGGVQLKKIRIRISNFRGAFVFFRIFS